MKLELIQEESFDQYEIRSTAYQKPHTPDFWKEDCKIEIPKANLKKIVSSA